MTAPMWASSAKTSWMAWMQCSGSASAEGGGGIGSYEFGYFRESVVSARRCRGGG